MARVARGRLLTALLAVPWVLASAVFAATTSAAESAPVATVARKHDAFFKAHCLKCHAEKETDTRGGGVRLDDLPYAMTTVAVAERWQKILNALNSGEMPPPDEPRPDEATKTNLLAELSAAMVQARKAFGDQGRVAALRRLNRREYINTIRELLGLETDAAGLPEDKGGGSYDTFGGALFMSSDQISKYLDSGHRMVSVAFAELRNAEQPPPRRVIRMEPERTRSYADRMFEAAALVQDHHTKRLALDRWQRAGESPDHLPNGLTSVEAAREAIEALKRPEYSNPSASHASAAFRISRPRAFEGRYLPAARGNYESGGDLAEYAWIALPADLPTGSYVLRVRTGVAADAPPKKRFLEVCYAIPGDEDEWVAGVKPNQLGGLEPGPSTFASSTEVSPISEHQVTASTDDPQVIQVPIDVRPGSRRIFVVREKALENLRFNAEEFSYEEAAFNGYGTPSSIWVDSLELEGPLPREQVAKRIRQLIGPETSISVEPTADEPAKVRAILERFAVEAFRGTKPAAESIDGLVAMQQVRRKAGSDFLTSLVEPLAAILASPGFLYLHEPSGPATQAAGGPADGPGGRLLSDLELASRLSYFLWSAPPDEPLMQSARSGSLRTPQGLAAEATRLIADPRSRAFAQGFVTQWLTLDRLDGLQFEPNRFRAFDEMTRRSAKAEVWQTFHTLLTENLDARKLLTSDFVVVNAVLADYYGIPADTAGRPIMGMEFRKVSLPANSPRGGLLGMACILAMGSNGESSSPVERGAWILRKLLHDPPPPAPPNVPQLNRLEGKIVTARERLLAHQEESQCSQCHRRIDPIGFGLENFDAAGRWREFGDLDLKRAGATSRNPITGELINGHGVGLRSADVRRLVIDPRDPKNGIFYPIDPSGSFFNGPSFANYFEFRDLIAARGDDFLRGLIENLYEYALGRPLSFSDTDAIDYLVAAAKADGGGLAKIVARVVATPEFRNR